MHLSRPDHSQIVRLSMETIMITVIDESEEVPMDLLEILLTAVKKGNQVMIFRIHVKFSKLFIRLGVLFVWFPLLRMSHQRH